MISVLYEDPSVLVVDKPPGIPTDFTVDPLRACVLSLLKARGIDAHCVHRLDKDTTGALVLAKTKSAQTVLNRSLTNHQWRKIYLAVVCGRSDFVETTRESYLASAKDRHKPQRSVEVRSGGKKAITRFFTVCSGPQFSTLCCVLLTGRTHQVRVHCGALGLPVLGDGLYGTASGPSSRMFLLAWQVGFPHPVSGEPVRVVAPIPQDWGDRIPPDLSADTWWYRA